MGRWKATSRQFRVPSGESGKPKMGGKESENEPPRQMNLRCGICRLVSSQDNFGGVVCDLGDLAEIERSGC